jgi:hypothetical protein
MNIDKNYNEYVDVERLGYESGSGDMKEFSPFIINLYCLIQNFDEKIGQDITYGFGKDQLLFCGLNNIKEGDRVIRNEGGSDVDYRVTAVKRFYQGQNAHMEVKIRVFES